MNRKLAIIDLNRTLYDPDTGALMHGALELLDLLAVRGIPTVLFSRREEGRDRMEIITRFGLLPYFASCVFVDEKSFESLSAIIEEYGAVPQDTFVVGDYLHEDVRFGNMVGAFTIHYKAGKYAALAPESEFDVPKAVVNNLEDAARFIV